MDEVASLMLGMGSLQNVSLIDLSVIQDLLIAIVVCFGHFVCCLTGKS